MPDARCKSFTAVTHVRLCSSNGDISSPFSVFDAHWFLEHVATSDYDIMMLPFDTQTAFGTRRAISVGLALVSQRVRSGESHLQLDPTLEWHTCTADGRVGRDAVHLQPCVLQVWEPSEGV